MTTTIVTALTTAFFDRHTHPRQGDLAKKMIPVITKHAWGAVAMPNTDPRLMNWLQADSYLEDIYELSPPDFLWIGTCYLTDSTDPDNLEEGFMNGTWKAAKFYPANMTTNSAEAVTSISKIRKVLEWAARIAMPILVHGECADKETHPEFAEKRFMDEQLPQMADSGAPLILEHVSWSETAFLVTEKKYPNVVGATIAPQHLVFDSSAERQSTRFEGGFKRGARPKFICMPPLKMPGHNQQLMAAIRHAPEMFGAGTDIAGHPAKNKYQDFGACGCASARSVELYATAFEEADMLHLLPDFLGTNLLHHYGIKPQEANLRLIRGAWKDEEAIGDELLPIESLTYGMELPWKCVKMSQ